MNAVSMYISSFPESMYPPTNSPGQYAGRVIHGAKVLKESKVLICGTARNCDHVLPYTVSRIEHLREMCGYSEVFVFENDSTDNTKQSLQKWAREKSGVHIRSEKWGIPSLQDLSYERTAYMAKARNKYLDFVMKTFDLWDYVIIMDFDLEGGFSYEGVCNSIGYEGDWDVMGSNGLLYRRREGDGEMERLFYDAWAFRKLGHPEPHDFTDINLLLYSRGQEPIEVDSVFGGLAIYKGECFEYDFYRYKSGDCDHPTLHRQLKNEGRKVFLNPSQITLYSKTYYNIL